MTLSPAPAASEDAVLLKNWTRSHAAPAFEMIVRRHVDLVYTTALRYLSDTHLADDVTQAVFLILADKAASLQHGASLPAWLHQTTRYAAANARKMDARRRRHERIAAASRPESIMLTQPIEPDALLSSLDDAIGSLRALDRTLIIERYLNGTDIEALAAGSNSTRGATQKRLERAVDRLREYFRVRGVSPASLAAVPAVLGRLSASTAGAAPAHLVSAAASAVIPDVAVSSIVHQTLHTLLWTQLKFVLALAAFTLLAIIFTVGVGVLLARITPTDSNPATVSAAVASASKVEAKLASGPTIELVGVCESPSADKGWWQPDGTSLADAPYTKAFVHLFNEGDALQKGHIPREFALKVSPRLGRTGMERDWSLDGSYSAGNTAWICNPAEDGAGYLAMALDPADRPATLRFPIASGRWRYPMTIGVAKDSAASIEIGEGARTQTISMTQPTEEGGQTLVTVTMTQKNLGLWETRVIAIDQNGVRHPMTNAGGLSTKGEKLQRDFAIALPIEQITELWFEMRPFDEWLEFRNVSLHPGQLTDVKVVSSDDVTRRIAANDVLDVTIYDLVVMKKDATITARVDADGWLPFPYLQKVKVGGLTTARAVDAIGALLYERQLMHDVSTEVAFNADKSYVDSPPGPIGIGDDVIVRVFADIRGGNEISGRFTVDANGVIDIPQNGIGKIKISEMTELDAMKTIDKAVKRKLTTRDDFLLTTLLKVGRRK